MGIYLPNMEMPTTGLYLVSVDNTGGIDKTAVTVERMLRNQTTRQIVGSFELIPVPPHGDLIDRDAYQYSGDLVDEPVIIPAEEGE